MQYKISGCPKNIRGTIELSTSKSITNRLLIIQALSKNAFSIKSPSSSNDSESMIRALSHEQPIVDIGPAGTAMRFLTGFYALTGKEVVLTGSERMKKRPIKILVDALRVLGANIQYTEVEGFPPLKINMGKMTGGELLIDGSISSQYITALLLIAPALPKGLSIKIKNKLVSEAYVELTLNLMKYMGVSYTRTQTEIRIPSQPYIGKDIQVEADWSSASYWYEMAALAEDTELTITGLTKNSLQGDSIVSELYKHFGVSTSYLQNGIILKKMKEQNTPFKFDFNRCPDLAQTLVVTCVLKGVAFEFSGVETLRIKETDRIKALQNELGKLGFSIQETAPGIISWDGTKTPHASNPVFKTYDDHRMAMALAPSSMYSGEIVIDEPHVVSKSYPEFWDHLRQVGFTFH